MEMNDLIYHGKDDSWGSDASEQALDLIYTHPLTVTKDMERLSLDGQHVP